MTNVVEDPEVHEGAVPVPVDDKGGADHVRVPIAASGGEVPVHTDEGGVTAEAADGGGHVRVQVPCPCSVSSELAQRQHAFQSGPR